MSDIDLIYPQKSTKKQSKPAPRPPQGRSKRRLGPKGTSGRVKARKQVSKHTSKLVNEPTNVKVGFYFAETEFDRLEAVVSRLKPVLRKQHNIRATKNDILRACLTMGLDEWDEKKLASKLVKLLVKK